MKKIICLFKDYFVDTKESNLRSRLLTSAFWASIGGIISRVSLLFAFIMVARILGKEIYGEFSIIRSTTNMFVMFAGFGLGMTATKHIAEFKKTDPIQASRILTLSTVFAFLTSFIVAIIVFFSSSWLAANTINAPHLDTELKIGAIILFFSGINGAQTGALIGFEAFKAVTKLNIYLGFFSVSSLLIGAYTGGLNGTVWAMAVNSLISWYFNNVAIRKEANKHGIPLFVNDWWSQRAVLWKFSLPATLGGLLVSPVLWYCNTLLVNQPDGFSKMGLFDAAFQWYVAILFIPSLIGKIILPILSDLKESSQGGDYLQALKLSLISNFGISFLIAIIVSFFSPFIMGIYGEEFTDGSTILILLACSAVLVSVNNVVGQAIMSKGKMWEGMVLNIFWGLALVVFSSIFIGAGYGAIGLALAYLISYGFHAIFQFIYLRYFLKISFGWKINRLVNI